jgi:hypothetical protein
MELRDFNPADCWRFYACLAWILSCYQSNRWNFTIWYSRTVSLFLGQTPPDVQTFLSLVRGDSDNLMGVYFLSTRVFIYMRYICDLARKVLRRACLLHQKCFALFRLEWSQKNINCYSPFMSDVQLPKRRMCWCFVPLQTRFWNWLVVVVLRFEETSPGILRLL